jgi:hypothetical protein
VFHFKLNSKSKDVEKITFKTSCVNLNSKTDSPLHIWCCWRFYISQISIDPFSWFVQITRTQQQSLVNNNEHQTRSPKRHSLVSSPPSSTHLLTWLGTNSLISWILNSCWSLSVTLFPFSFSRVSCIYFFFGMSHSTDADTHIWMITYPYEYMHIYPIFMGTSERLDGFDLEIHKVGQIAYHCRRDIAYH